MIGGVLRLATLLIAVTACVVNMPGQATPPVTSGGTEACREIMETCDTTCQTPDCVQSCTARGTPDAQRAHNALISCGQRNFCTSEDCMRASCGAEIDACQADTHAAPGATDPTLPPPPPPTE
jgi:hypothetical protein